MKTLLRLSCLFVCLVGMSVPAAQLIRDGKLQTDLNANTNRITNATDFVTASAISLTNLAAQLAAGGAAQWVFIAISSPTNYFAPSTRTGAILYVQGCITNGGSGGGSTSTLYSASTTDAGFISIANPNGPNIVLTPGTNLPTLVQHRAHGVLITNALTVAYAAVVNGSNTNNINIIAADQVVPVSAGREVLIQAGDGLGDSGSAVTGGNLTLRAGRASGNGDAAGGDILIYTGTEQGAVPAPAIRFMNYVGVELMVVSNGGVYAPTFYGNGAGITNVNSTNSTHLNAISGTNYVRGVVLNGGTNRPDSNGLAQLGVSQGFHPLDFEGSLNGGITARFAPGLDLISTRSAATNELFDVKGYTVSTVTITNTVYVRFGMEQRSSIAWTVRASQPSGTFIFRVRDQAGGALAITQTVAAASTSYTTNLALGAVVASEGEIEARYATTNALNTYQYGVRK